LATWGGLSGSSINSLADAATSSPTTNAAITAVDVLGTTTGSFGYPTAGNARFYIQSSSSSPNGANQLVLAINTVAQATVVLQYDIESVVSRTRTIGVICPNTA
jgi:hypothetical protein